MKKYLVIGNPIKHSLSPKLHNYWIKQNHINAIYEKKKLEKSELENLVLKIKQESISGAVSYTHLTLPTTSKV